MDKQAKARLRAAEHADVALLAPVPRIHLVSGLETCREFGRVAYGSNDGMTLSELRAKLDGGTCVVLIYPSLTPEPGPPTARWRAVYRRLTEARNKSHPDPRLRPRSTDDDTDWMLFWEVTDLEELAAEEAILVSKLRAAGAKRPYAASFVPHGPTIIDNPY